MQKYILLILFLFFLLIFYWWRSVDDGLFHIYFLDVGQGDSILIRTPERRYILVDGGRDRSVLRQLGEVMKFFEKKIDLIVSTHPDLDHIQGLIEVLARYEVREVLIGDYFQNEPLFEAFYEQARRRDVNISLVDPKNDRNLDGVFLNVLYPERKLFGMEKNSNNLSIVIRLTYKEKTVLLTGDLEKEGEELLVNKDLNNAYFDLKSDILKVGHHGSKSSSGMSFLRLVDPQTAVIQSGRDNPYGHPHPQVIRNLKQIGVGKILDNAQVGRIEFAW